MELEDNFAALLETLRNLHRNTLLRKFFFSYLNIHYETSIFKAQGTNTRPRALEKPKVVEEVKIDAKVEEALEVAKKVWTGTQPVEAKKGLKKPTNLKQPADAKIEVKKAIEKKHEARPVVTKKPVVSTPVIISDINPLETYSITSVLINQELMEKYQDLKARHSNSMGSNLGGLTQGKKAEATAKKNFMAKLTKKFTSKNIRSDIDTAVAESYAAHKVITQIQTTLNDESTLRSFFEFVAKPNEKYTRKEDRVPLFRACFIMNWMQKALESLSSVNYAGGKEVVNRFNTLIRECMGGAEVIEKSDGFGIEKGIVMELMKTCTPEEVKEVTEKYHKLDNWRLGNEINKFISANLEVTKSLPGLRVLHSLGCKNGRSFCTFTKI